MGIPLSARTLLAVVMIGSTFFTLASVACAAEIAIKRSPDAGNHFSELQPDAVNITATCPVYVPAYSQIYLSEKAIARLAVTLSIRNIDPQNRILVRKIDYFDTQGTRVDTLVDGLFALAPMSTASFVIEQKDMRGGAGANFIVEWATEGNVSQPIIEAIMAGFEGTKGLSFSSRGVALSPCQAKP